MSWASNKSSSLRIAFCRIFIVFILVSYCVLNPNFSPMLDLLYPNSSLLTKLFYWKLVLLFGFESKYSLVWFKIVFLRLWWYYWPIFPSYIVTSSLWLLLLYLFKGGFSWGVRNLSSKLFGNRNIDYKDSLFFFLL